ncbi:MAG: hypothetical protein ACI4AQ_06120 [Lachnospiraceae bacterium]
MDKPQVDIENADLEELNKLKKWLFSENIRLEAKEKDMEDERALIQAQKGILAKQQRKNVIFKAQLENQKALFEKQWAIMENELRRMTVEKEQFERKKAMYKDEILREARKDFRIEENGRMFFKGITDGVSLRKRYKELMKIYHPDNANGDSDTLLAITKEYERLKSFYFE